MKKFLTILTLAGAVTSASHAQMLITGIIDGPRTGGLPKAVELFVTADIPDLSLWDIVSYANGGSSPSTPITLSGSATAGDYIYVASESPGFTAYFGFAPGYTGGAMNVNGDDTVALRLNTVNVDVFGVVGVDGTGTAWEYLDTWFYRNNGTAATTTWTAGDWSFAGTGINALDVLGTSGVNPPATGDPNSALHMPIGTFDPVPEPSTYALLALSGAGVAAYRLRRRARR
jgi:predicted extracellular nuclease